MFMTKHPGVAYLGRLSVLLYGCSLVLPALLFNSHSPIWGYEVLMWGWWGVLVHQVAWFANPIYASALINYRFKRRKSAITSAAVAVLVGLTSFAADGWWFNEAGPTSITALGPGFYAWILSFGCLLLAAIAKPVSLDSASDGVEAESPTR